MPAGHYLFCGVSRSQGVNVFPAFCYQGLWLPRSDAVSLCVYACVNVLLHDSVSLLYKCMLL